LKQSDLKKLRERDKWCWECGETNDLVPHHRINRGMGGSKSLDNLQNVILVCALYNGLMESDSEVAKSARLLGHKISKFSSPSELVFDNITQSWYQLDTTGGKQVAEPPQ
jgi:hypothetical protein